MSRNLLPSDGRPLLEPLEPRLLLDATLPGQEEVDPALKAQVVEFFNASPAVFVENQGQWADESVRYLFQRPGAGVAFTDAGPIFHLYSAVEGDESVVAPGLHALGPVAEPTEYQTTTFRTFFEGANTVTPVGLDAVDTSFNYFVGDQSQWRSGVPGYSTIAYFGIYDGVDLYLYGSQSNLKYEFHVAPGADWSEVIVSYDGIEGLTIDPEGNLHVQTSLGELIEDAPYIYQDIDGERIEVAGAFELVDVDTYTFSLSEAYDATRELVFDPDLAWSTYLGGSSSDGGRDIAVDASGNAYVTGWTYSSGWATPGPYDETHNGGADVFVAKLDGGGTTLAYCTYLGGANEDGGYGIAVDASGNACVTGWTFSSGCATPGAYDETHNGGRDVFVAKLNAGGTDLVYCTYLGGDYDDFGYGIAVDSVGNAYVTGPTWSSGWATPGAYDQSHSGGNYDVFVAKLNADGTDLAYCTYLGGSGYGPDYGQGIAVDASGNAHVVGYTFSSGWATPGAYDETHNGGYDVFVAKLNADGSDLIYCTYLGGGLVDSGYGIAIDVSGNAYVTGITHSSGWATPGAYDETQNGESDVFVAKLNAAATDLVYCTYLGGSMDDKGYGITVDASGNAYVTGITHSSGWATPGAYDETQNGESDVFLAKLNAEGTALVHSTYLGGDNDDFGYGIAVDSVGNAYMTGRTSSSGWATAGAYDETQNGESDVFVAKLTWTPAPLSVDLQPGSDSGMHDDDNLTTVAAAVIDIMAFHPGDTINIHVDGSLVGQAAQVSGTLYEYSFLPGQLTEGDNVVTARSFDGVGESVDSPPLIITLDTTVPLSPYSVDLNDASDTGISGTDNVTGDTTPTFDVTGAATYARVYRDGVLVSEEYDTSPVTLGEQPYGTYEFTGAAVDGAGNVSEISSGLSVTFYRMLCDSNSDGRVDGGDLAVWQVNYDPLGLNDNSFWMADWNVDGNVDGVDLAYWQINYDPIGPGGGGAQLMMSVVGGPPEEQAPLVPVGAGVSALVPMSDIDETTETTGETAADGLSAAAPVNVGGQIRKRDRLNDPQAQGHGRHAHGRHLARWLGAETDAIDLLAIPGLRLPV